MALSPKLQQKQALGLTMTPQLQQAIKLLAMTNLELQAFVEEQLESNPLLERGTGLENRRGEEADRSSSDMGETSELDLAAPSLIAAEALDIARETLAEDASPAERQVEKQQEAPSVGGEIEWSRAGSGGSFSGTRDYDPGANQAGELSLREHLNQQLAICNLSTGARLIGAYLIDQVDENGYLREDLDELATRLGVETAQIESVLTTLQTFEPTGVMARSLSECLGLQLREKHELDAPMQILLDHLEMLAAQDLTGLAKICGLSKERLGHYIARLKALSPKPGLAYGSDITGYVEPDVLVRERPDGGWSVELNTDTLPHVLVNTRYYAEVCGQTNDLKVKSYMSECAQNANWLVKSLDQRARTILKVASEIVKQQDGFFVHGVNHLRPLNLKTIAEAIDMHESTVSRVTSNKYLSTTRGTFELKYFFTAAIPSLGGGEAHSAEAVRHKIKILISEEKQAQDVLSDDKIVKLLLDQGIDIARRTVAKYRESLGIASSVQRRRILKNK